MHEKLQLFLMFLAKQGYSPKTVENYARGVEYLFKFNGGAIKIPSDITVETIEKRKNSMQCSARTGNLYLNAVRKFLWYLALLGENTIDPKNVILFREHRVESEYITKNEVDLIMHEIEQGYDYKHIKLRNKCIVRMLWETGLRVSELTRVSWNDVKPERSFKIMGKGGKERIVFYSTMMQELLLEYKISMLEIGINPSYVFCSFSGNSKGHPLSRNSIEEIIRKLNITNKHITPHSYRHGMATHALWKGGNVVDIQKMLGHSNMTTTSTYLHSCSDRIKKVQELCR